MELENDKGEEFGMDAFVKLLSDNSNMSMEDLIECVKTSLKSYKGTQPYIDDIALLAVRFR